MTNKERSVGEIVAQLKRAHPCIVTDKIAVGNQSQVYIDVFNSFTQPLQAERQKRDGVVETVICNRRGIHTCRKGAIHIPENFIGTIEALTQPNNK